MPLYSPITWVPFLPWAGIAWITWDALSPNLLSSYQLLTVSVYLALYLIASFWHGQVTKLVPAPYLDEIFHIPQAQAYCVADFHIWDPKLTTPPGLYAFATLFANLGGIRNCDVWALRFFNTLVLIFVFSYAVSCGGLISKAGKNSVSPTTLHTAFNMALFPPLFFFAGLFYTDVLSTCLVLRMYKLFLEKKGEVWLYLAGIFALTMRQTNIFWVAAFMGGLEAVRTLKDIPAVKREEKTPDSWKGSVQATFDRWMKGDIHDIPLRNAEIHDFLFCALSIAVAIIFHPLLILKRLFPYVALLLSFAAFVFWNGGVVLGDKSNHVATLHLPQLLYLWPFIAFFSFPLLLPSLYSLIHRLLTVFSTKSRIIDNPQPLDKHNRTLSTSRKLRITNTITLTYLALIGSLIVIRFNTLIHPFTLADNRHYMFYIFRYTILRHPLIRYFIAPVYLFTFYLCYRSVFSTSQSREVSRKESPGRKVVIGDKGPTTSWFLIWLLSTALSLITAPLVEPRYFIIPWLIWRLHVPSFTTPPASPRKGRRSPKSGLRGKAWKGLKYWAYEGHDPRLWVETAWFLVVNAVTGYIFLFRTFTWPQEPGELQRFMW